LGLFTALFRR